LATPTRLQVGGGGAGGGDWWRYCACSEVSGTTRKLHSHSPTHPLTHALTHALTHSLMDNPLDPHPCHHAGGMALRFYASVRVEIRKSTPIKDSDAVVGYTTVCKVVKNKVAPPLRSATFDMIFGQGISRDGELLDEGLRLGLVRKSGAWFRLRSNELATLGGSVVGGADDAAATAAAAAAGEAEAAVAAAAGEGGTVAAGDSSEDPEGDGEVPMGQGREKAKAYLRANPDVAARLAAEIRRRGKAPGSVENVEAGDDDDHAEVEGSGSKLSKSSAAD
jgi:hypothetical protein